MTVTTRRDRLVTRTRSEAPLPPWLRARSATFHSTTDRSRRPVDWAHRPGVFDDLLSAHTASRLRLSLGTLARGDGRPHFRKRSARDVWRHEVGPDRRRGCSRKGGRVIRQSRFARPVTSRGGTCGSQRVGCRQEGQRTQRRRGGHDCYQVLHFLSKREVLPIPSQATACCQ